jgi:uncharacterized protein HemY
MARKYLKEAIKLNPRNPSFYYHLGMLFHQEQDFSAAIKELQEAIKLGLSKKELADARKLLQEMKDRDISS